jgi:CRISPR-associated endonuclease Csn1
VQIQESLILGIDLGIASCGWAVIDESKPQAHIVAMGVRTFDAPETDKERTPTNQLRRQFRGMRRVIHRRAQRMNELRQLFREAGLIQSSGKNALWIKSRDSGALLDPWKLRAEGLERKLTGEELAVVLGHVAKHRGFKSNSKRDRGANAPKDTSDMLKQIAATHERLMTFRTVGQMFATAPELTARKRNRDGDYTRSILRDDQDREVRFLFDRQRAAGNRLATQELEGKYIGIAFFQRPLADSENKIGQCPFEQDEKRAAKYAYSFELFRFLQRLTSLRIQSSGGERPLTPQEIALASDDFGGMKGMTFKRLRKILDLADGERFAGVPLEEEGKRDVVSRSGDMAPGTYALRKVLGDTWRTLLNAREKLDRIAFVLSFREDVSSIRKGLEEIGLEPLILEALMKGVEQGEFSGFKGAGHISAKACRNLIPYLMRGMTYDKACAEAGYNHAKTPAVDLTKIGNPVARKALTEAVKQVRAIAHEYGLPGRIHVELACDVGKSKEERDKITSGIEKRNKEKDRTRAEFRETVGQEASGGEDLLRFELWKEQNGRCLYTDQPIHPNALVASDNSVQVDHILPWSRSGDDSFVNKTLCTAKANQDKRGATPYEWFGNDEKRWDEFVRRIEGIKSMKGRKKRNYLLKDSSVLEEKFRPRNLNDTKYATRALLDILARMYPDDVRVLMSDRKEINRATEHWYANPALKGRIRVASRPGALTDRLRRGWGIQGLKKDAAGKRIADDRHHAVDALIVAATTEGALQKLTRAFQEEEKIGGHRDFARLDPPWPGFIEDLNRVFPEIFVSRAERRRARGEAHAATIRQIGEQDGALVVYERKSVDALSEKDLERINDPERNAKLIISLREWIEAGKPKDRRPLSPKGDPVSKVRLKTIKKVDVLIRDGAADRGEMARVDAFRKQSKKGVAEYFLVPIYPHQIADAEKWPKPPNRAVAAFKDEDEWFEMTPDYEFMWSMYPMSFVELEKMDKTFIDGYFRGMHRGTGNINISAHQSKDAMIEGIGPRRLKMKKFTIDRLGRRFEIPKETRTWHGAVCT